jgi:small-conductance mechanosensitive channel
MVLLLRMCIISYIAVCGAFSFHQYRSIRRFRGGGDNLENKFHQEVFNGGPIASGFTPPIPLSPSVSPDSISPNISVSRAKYGNFKNYIDFSFVDRAFQKFLSVIVADPDLLKIVAKGMSIAFWTYTGVIVLGTLGVDTRPLNNLMGLTVVTAGFATRDLLSNTVAGVFLLFSKPFIHGSVIKTCGYSGTVLAVDLRYVKLLDTVSNNTVLIPLSLVYSGAIEVERY